MLRNAVQSYLALKRSVGFRYRVQESLLDGFAAFAEQRGDQRVKTATVLDWAAGAPSEAQRRNRLLTVRRFAIALFAEDAGHEVPPPDAMGTARFRRCKPHIYSDEEITRLLRGADKLTPTGSLRPKTFVTLFALLATTGLRISEALKLRLEHVTDDGLVIQQTKFFKSRLVPLHETARHGLDRYLDARSGCGSVDDAVFLSLQKTKLSYSTAVSTFLTVARRAGLREGPGRGGPRLHDLRHTFAVRSLEECARRGNDVARHMVALSTYLGQAHVSDTYWYLQATPALMVQIADAGEALLAEGRS